MAKIANHKINNEIRELKEFQNYNGTINAYKVDNSYKIIHWSTKILEYDLSSNKIVYLLDYHYSQTTSTLVGRIVRSLPFSSVNSFISELAQTNKKASKRLARMLGLR